MTSGDGAPGSEIGDVPNQASRAERPARSSRAEIVTAVATILGIPAGFLVLHLTLSDNEQEQFEVAGTQMCIDYRNQVLALHKDGLTTDQIKEFFRGRAGRAGGAAQAQVGSGGRHVAAGRHPLPREASGYTVPGGLRDGCGAIERITASVPRTKPAAL